MRPMFPLVLILAMGGCVQPNAPLLELPQRQARRAQVADASSSDHLVLSVKADPRVIPTGGIITVQFSLSNPGNERVLIGEGAGFYLLGLEDFEGAAVAAYRLGFDWPPGSGLYLEPKEKHEFEFDIPGFRYVPGGPLVPYEPGLYRLTFSVRDRTEESPPSLLRLLPFSDGDSRSSKAREKVQGSPSERT